MHHQDTQPDTLATTASALHYLLALRRAIGDLLVDVDGDQGREAATIYVPGWFEAGGPWQLRRVGGRLPWRATRADCQPAPGRQTPATLALAFDDQLPAAAVRMVQFDRANPFVLEPAMWEVAANACA